MKDQNARGWYVYRTLKQTAEQTQAPAPGHARQAGRLVPLVLGGERAHRPLGRPCARRQPRREARRQGDRGQRRVELAERHRRDGDDFDSVATLQANATNRPDTIEPNVTLVKAPDLWNLGFTGTGIVVGNQDTGMRWTHNALKPHYRGWNGSTADHNYNWHDSIHAPRRREPVRHTTRSFRATTTATGRTRPVPRSATTAPATRSASLRARSGSAAATWTRGTEGRRRTPSASSSSSRPTDLNGQNPNPTSAARDEQQLGLPDERALRAGQSPDDRREHAGRGHLRRGLRR